MSARGYQAEFEFFGRKCKSSDDVRKFLAVRIATLLSATGLIYSLFFTFIQNLALAIPGFFISLSLASCIQFFRIGLDKPGKYWVIFCVNIAIFYYAEVLGPLSGISNFFFAVAILPFVLFSFFETHAIFAGLAIPIVGFFCSKSLIIQSMFLRQVLTPHDLSFINNLTSFMTFAIVCIGVGAYSLSTDKVMSQLFQLNSKNKDLLSENKSHIERLNHSLAIQQKLFADLQNESSEKTLALEKAKTEQLAKEEALLREQEKIALIFEQQQTIENHQEELAEKASMDKMLKISESIQKKMLQTDFPQHDAFSFSVFYKPSHVISGDYFSVKELENGSVGFFVIDVTGHGTPAAILMTGVAIHLESLLSPLDPVLYEPAHVLSCLDKRISVSLYVSKAVACSYSLYEPNTRTLRFALGGAEPLRIWRNGKIITLTGGDGPVLNMFPDNTFCDAHICLDPGDVVLNITDGVMELRLLNGEPLIDLTSHSDGSICYDYRHLETILSGIPPSFLDAEHIGNSLMAVCQKPKDDITLLVLRANPA